MKTVRSKIGLNTYMVPWIFEIHKQCIQNQITDNQMPPFPLYFYSFISFLFVCFFKGGLPNEVGYLCALLIIRDVFPGQSTHSLLYTCALLNMWTPIQLGDRGEKLLTSFLFFHNTRIKNTFKCSVMFKESFGRGAILSL